MTAMICGFGGAVPAGSISVQEAANFAIRTSAMPAEMNRKVKALYRKTGISQRGSVLIDRRLSAEDGFQSFYPIAKNPNDRGPSTSDRLARFQTEAPKLASQAASQALAACGFPRASFTHLITVTCTGFYAPGLEIDLIQSLSLPPQIERIQVGFMGCHASINAFRVAQALCESDPSRKVLVCCVELCSLHYQYGTDTDSIVSNAIFADGAAAIAVTGENHDTDRLDPDNHRERTDIQTLGVIAATGSTLVPQSTDAMTWRIGDHGFSMTLSAEVPSLLRSQLNDCITPWLRQHGLSVSQVKGWAVHPGGSRILDAVEQSLDLSQAQISSSRLVLNEHGNMSSATLPFILNKLSIERVAKPWVMLGFGPGLEIEMALIR